MSNLKIKEGSKVYQAYYCNERGLVVHEDRLLTVSKVNEGGGNYGGNTYETIEGVILDDLSCVLVECEPFDFSDFDKVIDKAVEEVYDSSNESLEAVLQASWKLREYSWYKNLTKYQKSGLMSFVEFKIIEKLEKKSVGQYFKGAPIPSYFSEIYDQYKAYKYEALKTKQENKLREKIATTFSGKVKELTDIIEGLILELDIENMDINCLSKLYEINAVRTSVGILKDVECKIMGEAIERSKKDKKRYSLDTLELLESVQANEAKEIEGIMLREYDRKIKEFSDTANNLKNYINILMGLQNGYNKITSRANSTEDLTDSIKLISDILFNSPTDSVKKHFAVLSKVSNQKVLLKSFHKIEGEGIEYIDCRDNIHGYLVTVEAYERIKNECTWDRFEWDIIVKTKKEQ